MTYFHSTTTASQGVKYLGSCRISDISNDFEKVVIGDI